MRQSRSGGTPTRRSILGAGVPLLAALSLAVPGALAQSPSSPPASPAPPADSGAVRTVLADDRPEALPGSSLELVRYTLAPGTETPPTRQPGSRVARVETGLLTLTVVAGEVSSWTLDDAGGTVGEPIAPGETVTIDDDTWLTWGQDAVQVWANEGTEPLSVLTASVLDESAQPDIAVTPTPSGEPTPPPPVVERLVLTGPGQTGDEYRITIRDRSGRVVGARVPKPGELRFVGDWDVDSGGQAGPTTASGRDEVELLVRWIGTICGPVVTLDVAADLGSIRVIDRTPGCDAMGIGHAVVLRITGQDLPDPRDIVVTRERAE